MQRDFVRVKSGTLWLGSAPFAFSGANSYLLLTRSAGHDTRPEVLEVLDAACHLHCTVLRVWAFNDGDGWRALQNSPGTYDSAVFEGLDWLLMECHRRGLRLILTLTNYWPDYGGMQQYARWSQAFSTCAHHKAPWYATPGGSPHTTSTSSKAQPPPGPAATASASDSFYTDPLARAMFVANLRAMATRVNTLTRTAYRDDPTILAWELANEPRCPSDPSGDALQEWTRTMAVALRAVDPNHLIGLGAEGFFGSSTPDLQRHNPGGLMGHGEDWVRNALDPNIDFASFHLYPDAWLGSSSSGGGGGGCCTSAPPSAAGQRLSEREVRFARDWVDVHVAVARDVLRKPLVLGEFGTPTDGSGAGARPSGSRRNFYQQVLGQCLHHALREPHTLVGAAFWMLAPTSYPDYDGYTLHPTGAPRGGQHLAARLPHHHNAGGEGACVGGQADPLPAVAEFGRAMQHAADSRTGWDRTPPEVCGAPTAEAPGGRPVPSAQQSGGMGRSSSRGNRASVLLPAGGAEADVGLTGGSAGVVVGVAVSRALSFLRACFRPDSAPGGGRAS